jgi:hypothetical protein
MITLDDLKPPPEAWAAVCDEQAASICQFMEACGLYPEGIEMVNKLRERAKELRAEDGRNPSP